MEKDGTDVDDGTGEQFGEVSFTVEKGSPVDKVLQVLKHHKFDAEVTGLEIMSGAPGRHQLVKVEGVLCDTQAGAAFTLWAIILPSGMAYLLSAQGPGETDIPLWPRLYQLLLQGETGEEDDQTNGFAKMIRAHEWQPEGFRRFFGGDLLSIFSAENYNGLVNPASVAIIRGSVVDPLILQ